MLRTRIVTAIVLLGAFLIALFYLPPIGWLVGTAAIVSTAFWEWGGLMKSPQAERMISAVLVFVVCVSLGVSCPFAFIDGLVESGTRRQAWEIGRWFYYPAVVFWAVVVPMWLRRRWTLSNRLVGYGTGILVVVPAWVALIQLRNSGALGLLAVMAAIWLADIAAYFTGRAFGHHKLAPAISPGKTWEGAVGAGVAVILYGVALSSGLQQPLASNLPVRIFILILLTTISVTGDLFESLLKRQVGLKDSSNLLPGHGGILDRIDSLTSTLPFVALVWFNVSL